MAGAQLLVDLAEVWQINLVVVEVQHGCYLDFLIQSPGSQDQWLSLIVIELGGAGPDFVERWQLVKWQTDHWKL